VPWDDWGPSSSRLFDSQDIPTRLLTASSGERYVRLARDGFIHLLDFNPHHVRLELARVRAGAVEVASSAVRDESANAIVREGKEAVPSARGTVEVVHYRTMLTHGQRKNPWREKLYGDLPYVLTVSKESYPFSAVAIDEERVLVLWKVLHAILSFFEFSDQNGLFISQVLL
jgi:hypothetical protein